MKRVYEAAAYGADPVRDCFWTTTAPVPSCDAVSGETTVDVAIVGAGFTGISAAYHLASAGVKVALLDANYPTFGATGRNGGFCCLGGGKITNKQLDARFGQDERRLYRATEVAAVENAKSLIHTLGIDVDAHSTGETQLAHNPQRAASFVTDQIHAMDDYGVNATLHSTEDLAELGMKGAFHGGLTIPIGFALNPRKFALGLLSAAMDKGAMVFAHSPVSRIDPMPSGYHLCTDHGRVVAKRFIIATNGYSSDDMPDWMRARYMPVQSSVIVTDPISQERQHEQGWFSDQMAYDTRFLLHYFRKLPDNRFLFGMRGGLKYNRRSERAIQKLIRHDFDAMFPSWRDVPTAHYWSGLVALNRTLAPYVGPIDGYEGGFAGFGYHGNGVAMASYVGGILADLAQGKTTTYPYPAAFRDVPKRFPLGRKRRWLLVPIYRLMTAYEA